jgi:hypothetical protein
MTLRVQSRAAITQSFGRDGAGDFQGLMAVTIANSSSESVSKRERANRKANSGC